ncbi:unnamed protein product [Enterobius vermicularis]|uniref:Transmembrane protein n=1 Tax=Enterobius vermicularis TaxID=51028 RepID=A0A0N4UTK5_ENTVE|nr:unnamed protein product [Enterobius vermicularis]
MLNLKNCAEIQDSVITDCCIMELLLALTVTSSLQPAVFCDGFKDRTRFGCDTEEENGEYDDNDDDDENDDDSDCSDDDEKKTGKMEEHKIEQRISEMVVPASNMIIILAPIWSVAAVVAVVAVAVWHRWISKPSKKTYA